MEILKSMFVIIVFAHACYSMKINTEVEKLSNGVGATEDFGDRNRVAITDKFVVVGTTDDKRNGTAGTGSVTLFRRAGNVVNNAGTKIFPPDGDSGDKFGRAVALNKDCLVVAAKNLSTAVIYIFRLDAGYTFVQKFLPDKGENKWGGIEIAISDQNAIVVSNSKADGEKGAVYVYSFNNNKLAFQHRLQPIELKANARFGDQISVSNDKLAVSSYNDSTNEGNVYMFTIGQEAYKQKLSAPNTPKCDGFGGRGLIQVQGNRLIVGADCDAYAFLYDTRDGNTWQYKALLNGTKALLNGTEQFGRMVALFDDVAVVSAPKYAYNGMDEAGLVIVFQLDREKNNWVEIGRLGASDANSSDEFGGETLRIHGNIVVTGHDPAKFVYVHDISSLVRSNSANVKTSSTLFVTTCVCIISLLRYLF